jgi:hypothetical protein
MEPIQPTFESELTALINRYSLENDSDTPDFMLARYLIACLAAWNAATTDRDHWLSESLESKTERGVP